MPDTQPRLRSAVVRSTPRCARSWERGWNARRLPAEALLSDRDDERALVAGYLRFWAGRKVFPPSCSSSPSAAKARFCSTSPPAGFVAEPSVNGAAAGRGLESRPPPAPLSAPAGSQGGGWRLATASRVGLPESQDEPDGPWQAESAGSILGLTWMRPPRSRRRPSPTSPPRCNEPVSAPRPVRQSWLRPRARRDHGGRPRVELAQARRLVALGCPLETASRILL